MAETDQPVGYEDPYGGPAGGDPYQQDWDERHVESRRLSNKHRSPS